MKNTYVISESVNCGEIARFLTCLARFPTDLQLEVKLLRGKGRSHSSYDGHLNPTLSSVEEAKGYKGGHGLLGLVIDVTDVKPDGGRHATGASKRERLN